MVGKNDEGNLNLVLLLLELLPLFLFSLVPLARFSVGFGRMKKGVVVVVIMISWWYS